MDLEIRRVVRNGTLFLTRYSASSVASTSGVTAAGIFLGKISRVTGTPVEIWRESRTILKQARIASIDSGKSLWYADAVSTQCEYLRTSAQIMNSFTGHGEASHLSVDRAAFAAEQFGSVA